MLDNTENVENLLEVNNIEVIYNHVILVLKGVSLTVPKGAIIALLGGNGAGKTTTLKAISNLLHSERGEVTKGSITYRNAPIANLNPASLVKTGVIQVMEGRHCFEHLTVEENLMTGAYTRTDGNADINADLEKVYSYFPRLKNMPKSSCCPCGKPPKGRRGTLRLAQIRLAQHRQARQRHSAVNILRCNVS